MPSSFTSRPLRRAAFFLLRWPLDKSLFKRTSTVHAKVLVVHVKKPSSRVLVLSVVAAALVAFVLCFLPQAVHAENPASLSAGVCSEAEIDQMVERMLAAGDYVEGEAIVCYLPGDGTALTAQAESLLARAERLSEVTARQYAEATGEAISADGYDGLTAQAEDELVEVTLVRSEDASTSELLHELLRDPQVLSAEPNYLMSIAEVDSAGAVVEDDPASTESSKELASEELEAGGEGATTEQLTDEGGADVQVVAHPEAEEEAAPEEASSDELPSELTNVDAPTPAMTAQSDSVGPASQDLTGYQWFSNGTGSVIPQFPGWKNPGIKAPNWNKRGTTNASGVVAIMDTGVDGTHPDLAASMYHFTPEQQRELGCGEFGYAPIRDDKGDVRDGHDHGTHCAGIAAAEWNDFGVSGIANGVKIVAVAVSRGVNEADFTNDSLVKGYDFLIRAAKSGVDIRAVNRSIEMPPPTNAIDVMVQAAGEVGIVSSVATGNSRLDLDNQFVDGSYLQSSPYVLRVDAASPQDQSGSFSNYGQNVTDLFAPGVSILSTVPTTREGEKRYFVCADDDPLYVKTDFGKSSIRVTPSEESGKDLQVTGVSQDSFGVDGDSSCLKVGVSAKSGSGAEFCLDVPVGELDINKVQDIALAFSVGENSADQIELGVILEDGTNTKTLRKGIASNSTFNYTGWTYAYLHISDAAALGKGFKRVVDEQGNTCVRLTLSMLLYGASAEKGSAFTTDLYLDQIAFGKPGNSGLLSYQYFSGTSMAAPAVAASAAIVSSTIDEADPAARAATTVRLLNGSVRQAGGYAGLCKQNGQLDLSLLGQPDGTIPTIDSARVSGESLVLEGTNLTQDGTLTMGGKPAEVVSWSDSSVEVKWPEGLVSGLIPIKVKTSEGAEVCRAFILEAPERFAGSVSVYERDLAPINKRADGTSVMTYPERIIATKDGVLYAVADDYDDLLIPAVNCLMRSQDQGNSWAPVVLPRPLRAVSVTSGDGKIFVMGLQGDKPYSEADLELFVMDESTGEFKSLATYDEDKMDVRRSGILAYVNGHLFLVDKRLGSEDWTKPSYLCVQRFSDDYKTLTEPFQLKCPYPKDGIEGRVKVAVVENSIYVCGADDNDPSKLIIKPPVPSADDDPEASTIRDVGLERVDVATDGTLTSTDLSDTLVMIPKYGLEGNEIAMAASKEGVFFVSSVLADNLPAGTERTDTFVLRPGATAFEPYDKTLSYAPTTTPAAVCSPDGWLYAYAVSDYETPTIFGRATKIAEDSESQPQPDPEPTPSPDQQGESKTTPKASGASKAIPSAKQSSSHTVLPKTGDTAAESMWIQVVLVLVGMACATFGLSARRRS